MTISYMTMFVELSISFMVLFGWAAALYLIIGRRLKNWPFLTIASGFCALFTFTVHTFYPLPEDTLIYIIFVSIAVGVLSFILNSRSEWLNAVPVAGTAYYPESTPRLKHIHLRHLLSAAILLEDEGVRFYELLASRTNNEEIKILYTKLANFENKHKIFFENILHRWMPLSITNKDIEDLCWKIKIATGIFINPPGPDAGTEDVIKYICNTEKNMANFYLSFEQSFPAAWQRAHIGIIAMEERSHVEYVLSAFPQYKAMAATW